MKAVENSGTVIGLKGTDGIILAAEKLVLSKLHEPTTNQRIFNIDKHIGMVSFTLQRISSVYLLFLGVFRADRRC